ncbi:MAG: LTA synthase family protein, partial [Clostridia bacterium]
MNRAALAGDDAKVFGLLFDWAEASALKVCFGLIVVYLVFGGIYLLVKKAWISSALFGLISAVLGFVNYMKLMIRGDPFTPMDITLVGQAKELMSFVQLSPPTIFFVFAVAVVLWCVYLFFAKPDCPGKARFRYPILCILLLAGGIFIGDQSRVAGMLHTFDLYLEDGFLQRYYYKENGFVCSFTMNALSLNVSAPKQYSEEAVTEALEPYDFSDSTGDELYDVIIVLSESFFDIRELEGLTFSDDPLKNFDAIRRRDNCYYGTMYSLALGGGTVLPEFQILSGLSVTSLPSGASPYMYIREDTDTYITNYKDAGYKTTAIHLYDTSFYRRNMAYEYIGFDELIGLDELTEDIVPEYSRDFATDKTTEEAIEYYMDRNTEDGTPSVVFAITIE